jgi:membrane protein DedA with SNARE-associated domain
VLLAVIVGGVAAWGLFHALGALLGGSATFGDAKYRTDWRRAAVIVASFTVFLGGWALLLRHRANRRSPD